MARPLQLLSTPEGKLSFSQFIIFSRGQLSFRKAELHSISPCAGPAALTGKLPWPALYRGWHRGDRASWPVCSPGSLQDWYFGEKAKHFWAVNRADHRETHGNPQPIFLITLPSAGTSFSAPLSAAKPALQPPFQHFLRVISHLIYYSICCMNSKSTHPPFQKLITAIIQL